MFIVPVEHSSCQVGETTIRRHAKASILGFHYWPNRITLTNKIGHNVYQFLSFARNEKGEILWGEYVNTYDPGDSLFIYDD